MENRSKAILGMEDSAFARSLFKSMGYTDSELKEGKPLIGIANTWNTLVPGHYNLDKVAEYVKNGIYAAGGTAVEFGTIAACDGVAQGHEGMHYILPSREIICDSVEIMAQAHRLDGLVLLASCDKIVPAMLMAAARLDIPCIVCVGGPMLGGIEFDGRKSDLTSISEALGMLKAGKITECEYNSLENTACPGCGSCSFLGTANTMCCVSEALGMTLPGGALIPAAYAGRLRHSFESGRAIVELCKKGITARQILTKEAIRNAIKVTMAICGSTNAVLHLPAIANEAELDMNVLEAARDLGAGSLTVFRRVILPLSLPGVVSGITMVFVPSVSTFAISRMLGGGTELLLGDLIERQFLGGAYNPQLGAAISLVMMIIVLVCMLVMNRFGEGEEQAVKL